MCVRVTREFLDYSRSVGNDLTTPLAEFGFPGLRPGDQWWLCAARWQEALDVGVAPMVVLQATHAACLRIVKLADLKRHAVGLVWVWKKGSDNPLASLLFFSRAVSLTTDCEEAG